MRANLGRLSTFESLWEAWCDFMRVLIRVLQPMTTTRSELDLTPRPQKLQLPTMLGGFNAM